jgi:hypothetical protein
MRFGNKIKKRIVPVDLTKEIDQSTCICTLAACSNVIEIPRSQCGTDGSIFELAMPAGGHRLG